MSSLPAKRQRTEDALEAPNFASTSGAFSSFFHDLEDLPQPPDQPNVDGCPIIELQDTVEDVSLELPIDGAVRPVHASAYLSQIALPLGAVSALIRLGHKYEFKSLDSAVARITFENPATPNALIIDRPYKPSWPTRIRECYALLFDVLTLADIVFALPPTLTVTICQSALSAKPQRSAQAIPDSLESQFLILLPGPVQKGFGRGSKELGCPIANLPDECITPPSSVAKTRVYFGYAQVLPLKDGQTELRTDGDELGMESLLQE
ncbi:hypothetical protein K438DRAFT_1938661 [Mycena galopus ATCC 62051]|nr:hypothetical protein K438DRAFT_1938661 [Mycena galopus ATCC 62051]